MAKVDIKDLLDAGVHFGHRTQRWNPKMKPYIFEARNGIYVIDITKSAQQIENAANFLRGISAKGEKTLFVGCKKQAQQVVIELATRSGSGYVAERWLGGTLTNLTTIKKSVARMRFIDDLEAKGGFDKIPKKELAALKRENARLHKNLDGLKDIDKPPGAVVIVDLVHENIAVVEARRLKIPVIAIVDTNADPDLADYPIAGNDDAIRSIKVLLDGLSEAIIEGKAQRGDFSPKGGSGDKQAASVTDDTLTGVSA
ncbi:small subunit ribosomal protein S2 [Verrucomicrobium sp. GAS474]|uniref:30S ribosomal protein S2 n=1 Tax=Verrucomicrobium sp. GAS474 TaxID=1882831 RepID=UPI00087C9375|nr:30S ribosomal protein S2 [Verrucomicrobium sp. GAS474]SDT90233.1 small subunit ribosomal protein S2 [Verrucomicrobium sp. GAS474]